MKPSALTHTLLKIFAFRFFREHSGLLLFFFVVILNYCFFIKTAGVYREEDSVFYHLMLVMSFIVTPLIMLVVFVFWLIYTFKSWQFVSRQLQLEQHQFLFYSITSASRISLFRSWLVVQLVISIPFLGYWMLAMILGLIYHSYIIPLITLSYILLIAILSALVYLSMLSKVRKHGQSGLLHRLSIRWKKSYFMLFIYQVVHQHKLIYLLSKVFSGLIITGMLTFFNDFSADNRIIAFIVLGIVILHSFLIYQEHAFQERYLGFWRNLPFSRVVLYFGFFPVYIILLLPEMCWVLFHYSPEVTVSMLMFGSGVCFLLRSLVYYTGLNIYKYLMYVFILFISLFYALMSGEIMITSVAIYIISFFIFYTRYYRVKDLIKF